MLKLAGAEKVWAFPSESLSEPELELVRWPTADRAEMDTKVEEQALVLVCDTGFCIDLVQSQFNYLRRRALWKQRFHVLLLLFASWFLAADALS